MKIDQLVKENEELRKLLSEKYSAKNLFIFCASSSVALSASLVAWFDFGVKLIDPLLASVMLVGTLGFAMLAIWRGK